MSAKSRRPVPCQMETVESRLMMAVTASLSGGVLRLTGSDAADVIAVTQRKSDLWVPGRATAVPAASVRSIVVDARGGNDQVYFDNDRQGRARITIPVTVDGGPGRDIIVGGFGNDAIFGGADNDYVHGHHGNDTVHGQGGNDYADGGYGNDEVLGDDATRGNNGTINPADDGNDTAIGGPGDDYVHGTDGNDFVRGESGNDRVDGGNGDDEVLGDDALLGNDGTDNANTDGNDTVFGGPGDDYVHGNDGRDRVSGERGNDRVDGGNGDDAEVLGGQGDDVVDGGPGRDYAHGEDGEDWVSGGADDDTIDGGNGNDQIHGGRGDDALFGGPGADAFYGEKGRDRLYAFEPRSRESIADASADDVRFEMVDLDAAWTSRDTTWIEAGLKWLHKISPRLMRLSNGNELVLERAHAYEYNGKEAAGVNFGNGRIRFVDLGFGTEQEAAETAVHEFGHNWDEEQGGAKWAEFLRLSGWHHDSSPDSGEIASDELGDDWVYSSSASFARPYGREGPEDDWCTLWEACYQRSIGRLPAGDANRIGVKLRFVDSFFDGVR